MSARTLLASALASAVVLVVAPVAGGAKPLPTSIFVLKAGASEKTATVQAGQSIPIIARAKGAKYKDASIRIVGKRRGTATPAPVLKFCKHKPKCELVDTHDVGVTWVYQAILLDENMKPVGGSNIVTVEWVAPPPAPELLTAGDGTGTSSIYTDDAEGHSKGELQCNAMSSAYLACFTQQYVGANLTLKAEINFDLKPGQELRLYYNPFNSSDPTLHQCLSGFETQHCVLARSTSTRSVSAQVTMPSSKYGAHRSMVGAELFDTTINKDIEEAKLFIELCQSGQNPVCD